MRAYVRCTCGSCKAEIAMERRRDAIAAALLRDQQARNAAALLKMIRKSGKS